MTSTSSFFGVYRSSEPAGSVILPLTTTVLQQPCAAALSSLPLSSASGLTTASLASADTTLTFDSNALHTDKAHPHVEFAGSVAVCRVADTSVEVQRSTVNKTPTGLTAVAPAPNARQKRTFFEGEQQPYHSLRHSNQKNSNKANDNHNAVLYANTHAIRLHGPFVEHDADAFPLSPLACGTSHLCCGPPPPVLSAETEHVTAVNFLEDDLPLVEIPPIELPRTLSPEDTALSDRCPNRMHVPSTLIYPPPHLSEVAASVMDGDEAFIASHMAGFVTVSPTTCSAATTTGASSHGNCSFNAPLPNCSHCASADDAFSCGRPTLERRAVSLTDYPPHHQERTLPPQKRPLHIGIPPPLFDHPQQQQRHLWPRGLGHCDPFDTNTTLSILVTQMTPTPTTANAAAVGAAASAGTARCSEDSSSAVGGSGLNVSGGVTAAVISQCNRTSPRSLSECGVTTTGVLTSRTLPRVTSLDTVATPSSTRSRPALTPAATGLVGTATSTAGSTAASTIASVTYTRKNVSLGTLDFYGNPVTSLSTLLAQMSVRSGDREEAEQLGTRHNTQKQQQQHPQQRNMLSMQNLKAHTQQVGVMGPEDKIKRLRARVDTAAAAGTPSMLRRRGDSYPASGLATGSGSPTSATPTGKPQVDCLKDVLQECSFLCINDVINAIAETQAHELQEAQQQLKGGCATAAFATIATASAFEKALASPTQAATAAAATEKEVHTVGVVDEAATSTTTAPGLPPSLPSPHRTSSLPVSMWSGKSCSPLTRDATACNFTAATASAPTSADMIDPQRALSLAAAITEVSLNIDRASQVSSRAVSNLTAVSTRRSHFLRAASGHTTTCSVDGGEDAMPSVTSSSLPNLPSEVLVEVSHKSTVITPVQLQPTISCSSRASSSPTEVTTPFTSAVTVFPDDLLQRKVQRSSSSETAKETNQSATSVRGGKTLTTLSQMKRNNDITAPWAATGNAGRRASIQVSALSTGADLAIREKRSGEKTKCSASPLCGLSVGGQASAESSATCNSPMRMLLPRKDDGDCLAKSIIGGFEELGECIAPATSGVLQESTGALNNVTEVRMMIDSIACASFDGELATVRELRKWAKCVAQQEMLQPSTETEVTT